MVWVLGIETGSWRSIVILVSPLLLIVIYRLLLKALIQLTSYAWIICNIFYYLLWCLPFVMLLSETPFKVLLGSFKPRKVADRMNQAIILIIVIFFIFIGTSSFINNRELILRYLPQTILFMIINPIFEELYWRGLLFGKFREKLLLSATYSSIMFGLFHYIALYPLIPHLLTPTTLITITIFGFLWAILYHLSDSLFPPYICHSISDIVGYLAMSGLLTIIA